jgi:hypothetical protein
MDVIQYITILANNLQTSADKMGLIDFVFQQDNAKTHISLRM